MGHLEERTIQAAAVVRRMIYRAAQEDVRRAPTALPTALDAGREVAAHFGVTETTARRYIRYAVDLQEVEEVRCDLHWRVHLPGAGRQLYINALQVPGAPVPCGAAPQPRTLFVIDTMHTWDSPLAQRPILLSCRERTARILEHISRAPQPRR